MHTALPYYRDKEVVGVFVRFFVRPSLKRQILEKHGSQLLHLDIDGFRNIQEDFTNENLLYLGTEGLYITIDGGAIGLILPIKCLQLLYTI
jgi:hypothetical protein